MEVKKFKVYYGGFFSEHHEVSWEHGRLHYYQNRFGPKAGYRILDISQENIDCFLRDLQALSGGWRKNYNSFVCDGIQWEINIHIGDTRISHSGSNAFPHNFHLFLRDFRLLIGYPGFAEDYMPEPFFTWDEPLPANSLQVNRYNRRTKILLRKNKRTVRQLAEFLQLDLGYIHNQLKCKETFDFETLRKIAQFLDIPIADFLYEFDFDLSIPKVAVGNNLHWSASDELTSHLLEKKNIQALLDKAASETN